MLIKSGNSHIPKMPHEKPTVNNFDDEWKVAEITLELFCLKKCFEETFHLYCGIISVVGLEMVLDLFAVGS